MQDSPHVIKWFLVTRIHVDKENSSKRLMASEVPKVSVHKVWNFNLVNLKTEINCIFNVAIAGFHMTSLKFKLQNC